MAVSTRSILITDCERTKWLESQGFRVLRFWNNEVMGQIESVKQVIYEALLE